MMPKMDPRQMAKLMSQMGIKNEEVEAERVVIERPDGSKLVIDAPVVTRVTMQGQASFQVQGEAREEAGEPKESDASIVAGECGCTVVEAEKALAEANGDLAEAILKLKGG